MTQSNQQLNLFPPNNQQQNQQTQQIRHILNIQEPIWKDRSIGVCVDDFGLDDIVEISIVYINKKGERIYPKTYEMTVNSINSYPVKYVKKGKQLRIIPIKDLIIKT